LKKRKKAFNKKLRDNYVSSNHLKKAIRYQAIFPIQVKDGFYPSESAKRLTSNEETLRYACMQVKVSPPIAVRKDTTFRVY